MNWWSVILSVFNAGESGRHGSSRRQLPPRVTFLLNHQSTNLSVAGWISGFFSTARDIFTILKYAREMARDSTSESKNSSNEDNARKALTDGQLIGAFFVLSISLGLGIIFTTWIGCWLGMFTSVMLDID